MCCFMVKCSQFSLWFRSTFELFWKSLKIALKSVLQMWDTEEAPVESEEKFISAHVKGVKFRSYSWSSRAVLSGCDTVTLTPWQQRHKWLSTHSLWTSSSSHGRNCPLSSALGRPTLLVVTWSFWAVTLNDCRSSRGQNTAISRSAVLTAHCREDRWDREHGAFFCCWVCLICSSWNYFTLETLLFQIWYHRIIFFVHRPNCVHIPEPELLLQSGCIKPTVLTSFIQRCLTLYETMTQAGLQK